MGEENAAAYVRERQWVREKIIETLAQAREQAISPVDFGLRAEEIISAVTAVINLTRK